MHSLRPVVTIALALTTTLAVGCGDDDDDVAADEQRYCELTLELEEIGERVFSDLPDDPSDEDFTAAELRFVEDAGAELDELVEVAPAEIEEYVEEYVEGFRARARGENVDVSDEPLVQWEEENCPE